MNGTNGRKVIDSVEETVGPTDELCLPKLSQAEGMQWKNQTQT